MNKSDFELREGLVVMPPKYVGFDNVLPLICNLKARGWKLRCLFVTARDYQTFSQTPENIDLLENNSEVVSFSTSRFVPSFVRSYYLLGQLIFRNNMRVFFVNNYTASGRLFKRLYTIICNNRKGVYNLPPITAPVPIDYYFEYFVKALNNRQCRKILGKPDGKFDAFKERQVYGEQVGYDIYDDERLDIFGFPRRCFYLGYPKLDQHWHNYVDRHTRSNNDLINDVNELVVIFPKKGSTYLYESDEVAIELLLESIEVVQQLIPNTLIVVKPKAFRIPTANRVFESAVETFNSDKVLLDYTPTPILSKKAIIGIFNSSTSAYFDLAIKNVPCVEHARYGENYYRIHPNGSYLRNLGIEQTETVKELNIWIKKTIKKESHVTLSPVVNYPHNINVHDSYGEL